MPVQKKNLKKEMRKDISDGEIDKIFENVKNENKNEKNKILLSLIVSVIVIMLLGAAFYGGYFLNNKKAVNIPNESSQIKEVDELIEKVGKLMLLPKEEVPTIATVTDKDNKQIKEQAFFKNAQNGDKVIIYVQAGKAILYRPSENKIIEVSQVYMSGQKNEEKKISENTDSVNDSAQAAPEQNKENKVSEPEENNEPVKISLFNGTNVIGLAKSAESILKEKMPEAEIVAKKNAKGNYVETIVVDMAGTRKEEAQKIAEIFSGKVGELPEGETADSEIAVFLAEFSE